MRDHQQELAHLVYRELSILERGLRLNAEGHGFALLGDDPEEQDPALAHSEHVARPDLGEEVLDPSDWRYQSYENAVVVPDGDLIAGGDLVEVSYEVAPECE